jgi:hypothetical protein
VDFSNRKLGTGEGYQGCSGCVLVWDSGEPSRSGLGLSSYNTGRLNMDSIGYLFGEFHPSYIVNTSGMFRKRIGVL